MKEQGVYIPDWMNVGIRVLMPDIRPREIILYATIYGFTFSDLGAYKGGYAFLRQRLFGASKETVAKALQRLCEACLIEKTEGGYKVDVYLSEEIKKTGRKRLST